MADLDDARRRYHHALSPEDLERLPFYRALLGELERDEVALGLLASVRVEQRNPMLVLAALHLAALRGHDELGPIYEAAREGVLEDPAGAAARVASVLARDPAIVGDELWRSTQTNEPGRSAVLQAVIGELAARDSSLSVIDVGASAGINLAFDRFPVCAHDDANPLTLVCEDRTPLERSFAWPAIRARVGIDPHPLDLASDDDRLWLKACLWAEERRRHERFDAIVAALPAWPPVTMLAGTANEALDDAFDRAEGASLVVVMNTWVAFYLSSEQRHAYFEAVTRRCADQRVAWVSMESPAVEWPAVAPAVTSGRRRGASRIVVCEPGSSPREWGWCHPHGRWVERTIGA